MQLRFRWWWWRSRVRQFNIIKQCWIQIIVRVKGAASELKYSFITEFSFADGVEGERYRGESEKERRNDLNWLDVKASPLFQLKLEVFYYHHPSPCSSHIRPFLLFILPHFLPTFSYLFPLTWVEWKDNLSFWLYDLFLCLWLAPSLTLTYRSHTWRKPVEKVIWVESEEEKGRAEEENSKGESMSLSIPFRDLPLDIFYGDSTQ